MSIKKNKIQLDYEAQSEHWKSNIRLETNKNKRFWKWIWYYIAFPFVWLFYSIRDLRTAIIFSIVFFVYSGSVWGFYLASLLTGWTATETGKWLLGIGSTVWAWWLSPAGSPFILLCVGTTAGIKALIDRVTRRK